jgi:subtilisin family serine protease
MKRYIIRPRSPTEAPAAEALARSAIKTLSGTGARIVKSDKTSGQHVVTLSDADAAKLAATRPDLIVEEDQPIDLFRVPGLPEIVVQADQAEWQVTVRAADGTPIPECTVFAVGRQIGFRADTNAQGLAKLTVQPALVERLICSPRANFWSRIVAPPVAGEPLDVRLDPLDAALAAVWWRRLLGLEIANLPTGRGVRVCVIDSGIAVNGHLSVAGGVNTLDGGDAAAWNVDEKGHGTHVAGIIAARPTSASQFRGVAPDAELYSAKVFPGGFVSDIVEALDWARAQKIDLVNMSLGAKNPSAAMTNAISLAVDAGTTVIVAAGNDGGPVSFPGAFPDAICVSAIGKLGSFPSDSGHSQKIGPDRDWFGRLFSASFTNRGPEVDVCAPGVAITSTVPTGYAAWDGTSMACPVITGLLALALEAAPWLRTGTRSTPDALAALAIAASVRTGMSRFIEGAGLPTATRMLVTLRSWGQS